MTETSTDPHTPPTEDHPDVGSISVRLGDEAIEISQVQHWIEDGLHVFRSTEFDCMSEAEDEAEAVAKFIESAEDLFRFLDDVMDARRATEDETRTLVKLSRRFFELFEASERDQMRRRALTRPRRRPSRPQWQPLTAPDNSSELLHA